MAEETVAAAAPPAKEETAVTTTAAEEKSSGVVVVVEEAETPAAAAAAEEKPVDTEDSSSASAIAQSVSFKEESNRVSDLEDPEKKALDEFKLLIQEALKNHDFTPPPPPPKEQEIPPPPAPAPAPAAAEETTTSEADPPKTTDETSPPTPLAQEKEEIKTKEEEEEEVVVVPSPAPVVVDEDGAKTVEAIQETIVPSSSSSAVLVETKEETTTPPAPEAPAVVEEEEVAPEEVFIWGNPLLGDDKSDTVLLKFLRARDFKVKDAFTMLKNTVVWRKEFGIDSLIEEDLGSDLDKVVFMNGFDKEGHPVCYNVYGEFQNKELYQKTFSDEEKSGKFLRWRIQFLEKSIQKLDFSPGGICTLVQVNDLKNSPGPLKKELRQATNQALSILQDNYPEFVAKQIFINVPWWYLAFNRMISPFLTQRTKSKFVFAGPSKSADTLFKYIAPEQVPVQYGGMSKEGGEHKFSTSDAVTEVIIKPATKQTVEIPVSETCLLDWEVRVIGWDVSYGAEFVPTNEEGYTIIVQKTRKITVGDEPVISNDFKVGEAGKVVLTIDNTGSKKKKLLYRFKTAPAASSD